MLLINEIEVYLQLLQSAIEGGEKSNLATNYVFSNNSVGFSLSSSNKTQMHIISFLENA